MMRFSLFVFRAKEKTKHTYDLKTKSAHTHGERTATPCYEHTQEEAGRKPQEAVYRTPAKNMYVYNDILDYTVL